MSDLAQAFCDATQALQRLTEALKPRTEAEYWQWLRHNDPLRYIVERRAKQGRRSPVLGLSGAATQKGHENGEGVKRDD